MIQFKNLSKFFGSQVLFEGVSAILGTGEKVGLVGRNGSGKSTLARMIMGDILPDEGEIALPKDYIIGSVDQHISFSEASLIDESKGDLEAHELYKIEKILFGLGFSESDLDKDPKSFSGGFQVRINLAKCLVTNPNLLVLDEPTNYLDIVSLKWLSHFLKKFSGEIILITHDRSFMDSVITHTMGITRKRIRKIKGGTEKFYTQILEEDDLHERTRLNQEKKKKEIQQFVDRFRAKASKAKQAQSKAKMLERMDSLDQLENERDLGFSFNYIDTPGKNLLAVEDLTFGYGDENLFENLSFDLKKGETLSIIGKNGKGKSTLLNVLSENLKQKEGLIKYHPKVEVGYFGQTNIKRLHENNSVEQEIVESNPSLTRTQIRNICGSMMFEGDLAEKKIKVLSGGEKARVMLGKILAKPCNLLILDEPTNHLDMESIEILSRELRKFKGSILLVTHSEMLIRKISKNLIYFKNGNAHYFHGNYNDFLKKEGWEEEVTLNNKVKLSKKDEKKLRAELVESRAKECTPLKEECDQIESNISKLEQYQKLLQKNIQKEINEQNNSKIEDISIEIGKVSKKIDELFVLLENKTALYDKTKSRFDLKLQKLN